MIELKVHCDCGQKYKFDVEPVNNQMPFKVTCPICHCDGTEKANQLLQQMSVFKLVEPEPPAATSPATPPPFKRATSAPPPLAPAASAEPAPARLRVSVAGHSAEPATPAATAAPPHLVPAGVVLPPTSGRLRPAAAAQVEPGKKPSFGLGILGGFLGALLGSLIYFGVFKATGYSIFLALAVGALAGAGASWLGKGEGSKELGGITVVFVVMGVLMAQYFVLLGLWNQILDEGYTYRLKEAHAIVKAVPTGSDAEIRSYLASQFVEEGDAIKPGQVPDGEVQEFKDKELPECRNLVNGKLTKEQYLSKLGRKFDKKSQEREGDTFKGFFILEAINMRQIILLVVAGGLAYKLSTNA